MNALGQLFKRAMTLSVEHLKEVLPFELNSRYLYLYLKKNGIQCKTVMDNVLWTDEEVATFCANYKFNEIGKVQAILKAQWFGDPYYTDFMA